MSGLVKGVKKAVKKVGRFIKKHWKKIIIAAAIVFTAGIATVGLAGFSAAAASAGGGIGGALSAVGSTFVAGASAIGGTVGIGQGVTASTAGGAFADAGIVQGLGAGQGLTLGTGAAAQSLGLAPSTAASGASYLPSTIVENAGKVAGSGEFGAFGPGSPAWRGAAGGAASLAANTANAAGAKTGAFGNFMNSQWGGPVLQAGVGLLNGYMQQRAIEQAQEAQEPLSFYGVALKDRNKNPSLRPDQMFPGSGQALTSTASWRRPGLMGGSSYGYAPQQPSGPNVMSENQALAYDMQPDPNAENWLSEDADPTARYLRGYA